MQGTPLQISSALLCLPQMNAAQGVRMGRTAPALAQRDPVRQIAIA